MQGHSGLDPESSLLSWAPAFAGVTKRGKPRGIDPKRLKNELIYQKRYATREEAILKYIEIFYNSECLQARLVYLSPAVYQRQFYERGIVSSIIFPHRLREVHVK